MIQSLINSLPGGPSRPKPKAGKQKAPENVGCCVVCHKGVFSNEEYGRAPKPLLGKAHAWCGGV